MKTLVHGDDFVTVGGRTEAEWFRQQLMGRFEIKTKKVGNGPAESKEEKVLNRVIRVTRNGWEYEADQRHSDLLVKSMGLEEAKPVNSLGEDDKPWMAEEEEERLDASMSPGYRALAARANYLAMDRADIQYPTKDKSWNGQPD